MNNVYEYKCPCCGAALRFDNISQFLKCDHCGNSFSVETAQQFNQAASEAAQGSNFGWDTYNTTNSVWTDAEAQNMRVYVCPSCGGEIYTDMTTAATKCPYCDNNAIIMESLSGVYKPNYIIPFKIDKEEAKKKLAEFCKGKKLLPKEFTSKNHIEDLTGIYVPFWIFDCNSNASMQYFGENVTSWTTYDYRYIRTDYYLLKRDGVMGFYHVPVDASKKMDDTYMQAIEPYDYSQMVPFNTAYLSGFVADKFDVDQETSKQQANKRIEVSTVNAFDRTVVGFTNVRNSHTGINFDNGQVSYALLPVWMLHTKYEGKDYYFAMNGQTGKFVGELPMSKKNYWKYVIGIIGIAGTVAGLIASML
ncbi:MAG: hypothetical protein IKM87_09620 [Clostridia bacterium]|nr:hypothetical protein [Clostridia bacterium]MBR6823399.1 hypothetical protein [Clostridia bacterium]